MFRNHCLAKSIGDASWCLCGWWLEYFAANFGKLAVPIPPEYMSQRCGSCGVILKKILSIGAYIFSCGFQLHRDTNTTRNILNLARA
ncbi:MAG: transposase [Nostoc sp. RI_552]|nr:transposase [Nostoc sp. RI_552]